MSRYPCMRCGQYHDVAWQAFDCETRLDGPEHLRATLIRTGIPEAQADQLVRDSVERVRSGA